MTLTLYWGVRYYLYKQAQANIKPQNAKKLFNLRHSLLRNIIKRTFKVFKMRFQYFKLARQNFPLLTQVLLIYTLTAVYNFINIYNPDDLDGYGNIKDKEINKKNAQIVKEENNIAIN